MDKSTNELLFTASCTIAEQLREIGERHYSEMRKTQEAARQAVLSNYQVAKDLAKIRLQLFGERFYPHQYVKPEYDVIEVDFSAGGNFTLRYFQMELNSVTFGDLRSVTEELGDMNYVPVPVDVAINPYAVAQYLSDFSSRFWLVQNHSEGGIWCWYANPNRDVIRQRFSSDLYDAEKWSTMRDLARKRATAGESAPTLHGHLFHSTGVLTDQSGLSQ